MEDKYKKENRIQFALALRGMKQIELCEKTGLSKSAVNNWVKQRCQPKQTPIYLMAQALDVSEMWLAGYDAPMEKMPEQKKMDELARLTHKLRNNDKLFSLCNEISKLNDDQLSALSVMVGALQK